MLMSVSFLCLVPVFSGTDNMEKGLRRVFSFGFLLTITSLIIYSANYGIHREYRFEVAAISINWTVLLVTCMLLSIIFRKRKFTFE